MKHPNGRSFFSFVYLIHAGTAFAAGGCPPGMIPYSGNDPNSCALIPAGYYSNRAAMPPLPPEWSSRWGAIATYVPIGVLGTSNNVSSEALTKTLAIEECKSKGGLSCKIEVTYDNKCAVVVVGDEGYVVTSRALQSESISAGLDVCGGENKHCHVFYTACSRPVRIK